MPNHCYNVLKLTDKPEEINEALAPFMSKDGEDKIFDFNKVVRMPKSLSITSTTPNLETEEGRELQKKQDSNVKKYGHKDWYDWCVQNWGTKWNSYSNRVGEDYVSFETAWAPPTPIILKLAQKTGKTWTLMYSEPGCDVCGKLTANESGVQEDEQWSLKGSPKYFRKEMGITEEDIYSEEELEEQRVKRATKKVKKVIAKGGKNMTLDINL